MRKALIILLLALSQSLLGKAQTNNVLFGQNKVQLRTFNWKYYQSENAKIYFYDRAGIELSRFVAEQLENDLQIIQKRIGDIVPQNGFDVIVYNCYDDYQQNNIGIASNNNIQNNISGQINLVNNKMLIYFSGTHEEIKRQLRQGLYSIILEKTLFGTTILESLRNSLTLNFPKWYTEGYLNYMVDGWDSKANNDWKTIILNPKQSKKFEVIANQYPELAGKAFWKYLIEKYGEKSVRDFIFIAQNETNLNKASKALTGEKIVRIFDSLYSYYHQIYEDETTIQQNINFEDPLIQIANEDPERTISSIKVSPRGMDVAYVSSKFGQFNVILQKSEKVEGISKNTFSKLLSGGYLNHNLKQDPNYPILAWSNTGFKLGIIYRKYNQTYIKIYDAIKGKITDYKIPKRNFDRALSFTFMEDDDFILLSAVKNGQSDLFEYELKRRRISQITDDPYDDLEPVYVSGGSRKGIVFLSNRTAPYIDIKPLPNELPTGKMKAYFYSTTTKSFDLLSLTPNEKGDVSQIIAYGQDNFAYLTNENGVYNRNVVIFKRDAQNRDTAASLPVTNGNYSILYQQYNPASKSIADVIKSEKGINIYFRKAILPEPFGDLKAVTRKQSRLSEEPFLKNSKKDELLNENQEKRVYKNNIDKSGSSFQTKFQTPDATSENLELTSTLNDTAINSKKVLLVDSTYIRLRSQKYRRSFKSDFYGISIENNQIFTKYKNFSGAVNTPEFGGMLSASLYDKMEDYRFTGAIKLPWFSDGSGYYFQFDNFRRRIDWGLTYYRETKKQIIQLVVNTPSGQVFRQYQIKPIINLVQGNIIYPINQTKSIRVDLGLRQDRTIIKAVDALSDAIPNEDKYYISSKMEWVHDDTRTKLLNIPQGIKAKIYGEYLYKFHDDLVFYSGDALTRKKSGGFFVIGGDLRYYTQIYKNVTFASRASFAHSGGNERVLFMLGGVDNSLLTNLDQFPYGSLNYAFQSMVTSMRGYNMNARNGNTYALANFELRVPVFETFFRRPVQNAIFKNLQFVAFTDVGNAWEGLINKQNRNTNNNTTFTTFNNPNDPSGVIVQMPYSLDESITLGYGVGLRTMLYGYFFRADAAWNKDGNFKLHLGLGLDF
ncbi:MAG TPA: hypothetical protein PKX92_00775 [Edaphocola sp.]|nr:hypothetical protein [Edaphocola sp.]